MLTGDAYFPGGLGEFHAPQNEFLVFEDGPSVDITLQWATYRDASDQTSLSRIWGGIHPPVDDIPGRIIGERVGIDAFRLAERYFGGEQVVGNESFEAFSTQDLAVFPNPVQQGYDLTIDVKVLQDESRLDVFNVLGQRLYTKQVRQDQKLSISTESYPAGVYFVRMTSKKGAAVVRSFVVAD